MVRFDKLFKTLKENGISQYQLYTYYGINRSQIHRLRKKQAGHHLHAKQNPEYFGRGVYTQ